jgi:hypothetical protein
MRFSAERLHDSWDSFEDHESPASRTKAAECALTVSASVVARWQQLLPRLSRQSSRDRYIWQPLLWNAMPIPQILRAVIRNPDSSIHAFPDENLER